MNFFKIIAYFAILTQILASDPCTIQKCFLCDQLLTTRVQKFQRLIPDCKKLLETQYCCERFFGSRNTLTM